MVTTESAEGIQAAMGAPVSLSVDTEFVPRGERSKFFACYLTPRGRYDFVIQFLDVRGDASQFPELLAECVEEFFGSTGDFALDQPFDETYGLLMRGIRQVPGFTHESHIYGFLRLVDNALAALKEEQCSKS